MYIVSAWGAFVKRKCGISRQAAQGHFFSVEPDEDL
jgi:hypothetical protein